MKKIKAMQNTKDWTTDKPQCQFHGDYMVFAPDDGVWRCWHTGCKAWFNPPAEATAPGDQQDPLTMKLGKGKLQLVRSSGSLFIRAADNNVLVCVDDNLKIGAKESYKPGTVFLTLAFQEGMIGDA